MDVECQKLEETQYFTLYAQEETNSRLELLEICICQLCLLPIREAQETLCLLS